MIPKKVLLGGFCFLLVFSSTMSALARTLDSEKSLMDELKVNERVTIQDSQQEEASSYQILMRNFQEVRNGDSNLRPKLQQNLETFIDSEKTRLKQLDVSSEKTGAYLSRLEKMAEALKLQQRKIPEEPKTLKRIKKLLDLKQDILEFDKPSLEEEFQMPKNPSKFRFDDKEMTIQRLRLKSNSENKVSKSKEMLMPTAYASSTDLPVIEDIQPNDEIIINSEIKNLAKQLDYNPVNISNYIRNYVIYEPYFGAKKGSVGCLREQICNDVDAASLTIALLRASDIPARYKSSVVALSMEQIKEFLGTDDANLAYATLASANVPVYTVSGNPLPELLDDADLSGETRLALEWVFVEAFYDYDENGGNIGNEMDLSDISDTPGLQALLAPYPEKQWLPIEPLIRKYTHEEKTILADSANFDSESFFYNYLQYQGGLDPVEKYKQEVEGATGLSVDDYLSTKSYVEENLDILPITLPYLLGEGEKDDGTPILMQTFSVLPDNFRYQVTVSLEKKDSGQVVLEKTYFGSEINNESIELFYEGFSEADEAVIESYGGIAMTPAELVDIRAVFEDDSGTVYGTSPIQIGESLILEFTYTLDGEELYTSEKFSTAGNHEGIYIALSKILEDPMLNDDSDPNKNSKILLEGNAAIAREYLRYIEEQGTLLEQSLDYNYNVSFINAVVTQNRVLNKLDGVPTTFDFKGLTVDASSFINDHSNRGFYKDHRKDFRLLWGLEASYYEGQLFNDLTSLNGVSTVKGLQYAYGNPGTYTVHVIDSGNKSVIDSLNFSENTKNNMKNDVDEGNTIITPDKPVSQGGFSGVLYISLDPVWTGTYAIGEQVGQNGGWSTTVVSVYTYCDSVCASVYWSSNGLMKFVYEDRDVDGITCDISENDYVSIVGNEGLYGAPAYEKWASEYGAPCMKETKEFGNIDHEFILGTNAAKLTSDGYDYWVKRSVAKDKIKEIGGGYSKNGFKFNPIAGTYYSYYDDVASYYSPYQPYSIGTGIWVDQGQVYDVSGDILSKLMDYHYAYSSSDTGCDYGSNYCGKKNWVLNKIGYPIENEGVAAISPNGSTGVYQDFVNGQIYTITSIIDPLTYYTADGFEDVYNENNGSWGKLGFPESDPYWSAGRVLQNFDAGRIEYSDGKYFVSPVWYKQFPGDKHFLVIDLDTNSDERVYFKSYLGLKDGISLGDKDGNGNLIKDYKERSFSDMLKNDENRKLGGCEPVAAINGDFFNANGPQSINFSMGNDYSGSGHPVSGIWTSMAISPQNEVTFTADYEGKKSTFANNYNVVGGGPLIIGPIEPGKFTDKDCDDYFGWNKGHDPCAWYLNERTVVGITEDEKYMIVMVVDDGPWDELDGMLNTFSPNYGKLKYANMFDGGGSSAIMFEGDIKKSKKPLMSMLFMYTDNNCY